MQSRLSRALALWLSRDCFCCMDTQDLELLGPPGVSDAHACTVHAVWWNLIVQEAREAQERVWGGGM